MNQGSPACQLHPLEAVQADLEWRLGRRRQGIAARAIKFPTVRRTAPHAAGRPITSLSDSPLVSAGIPPYPVSPADGESDPLPIAEQTAMLEKQFVEHPPLQVCFPGHRPHMWQATGDRATTYYVECSVCGVRSRRFARPDDAAHAWARRDVAVIQVTREVA